MRVGKYLLLPVILSALFACRHDGNERLLGKAEENMETCADSALWYLQHVEDMKTLTDNQQARYALLLTQAMHKCRIPLEDDSLINEAVEYYHGNGDRHRLAKSLLYKGLVHKQNHQVEDAVIAFSASERAFEGVEDNQYKALLYNHYGSLLLKQNLLEKSLECHKKAYQCELQGDSVHYVLSSCGQIAHIFEMMGMLDSADVYYRNGLSHLANCHNGKRNSMFLQNYAAFLTSRKQYDEAERILKDSECETSDSTYIYNVYASLASLYYETGRYEQARVYGERMLESKDSLIQCGGFLRLYEVHKRLGEMEAATDYHNRYRHYHSDIVMRRKTAEVAVIPHKLENLLLEQENRTAHRWLWVWVCALWVSVVAAIHIIRYLKRKHGSQMDSMDTLLGEKEQLLSEKNVLLGEKVELLEQKMLQLENVQGTLAKMKSDMGGLKGVVTRQTKTIEGLRHEQKEMKAAHKHIEKSLKEDIKGLKDRYAELYRMMHDELEKRNEMLKQYSKQEKTLRKEIEALLVEVDSSELLHRFLSDGGNLRTVLLMIELTKGYKYKLNPIRHEDYADLLKSLAEYVHPGIRQWIETDNVLSNKQELACLLALGYDDMEMLRMATNLKPNSVKAYCSQVKAALAKYGVDGELVSYE